LSIIHKKRAEEQKQLATKQSKEYHSHTQNSEPKKRDLVAQYFGPSEI